MSSSRLARTLIAAVALAAGQYAAGAAGAPASPPSAAAGAAASTASAEDILARSRATYAALTSYSDTGRVLIETGNSRSPLREQHSFVTAYQVPHKFLLFYRKGPAKDDEQLVLWWEGEDINTWWTQSQTHEHYPRSRGTVPFGLSSYPTNGVSTMIPSLLFSKAGMQGPLTSFQATHAPVTEQIDGKSVYKLVGEDVEAYGTGNVTGSRTVTLWIDASTLLVRKILEDTPHDSASGDIERVTVTLEPLANPPLESARFHFDPPA